MPETDIIQRMGFDASGAIAQINSTAEALRNLNASLSGVATGVKKWNTGSSNTPTLLGNIQKQADAASLSYYKVSQAQTAMASAPSVAAQVRPLQEVQQNLDNLHNRAKSFTISWQTLLRVVSTRLLIGGVNAIIRSLIEGSQRAMEFGIRIGEIGTIAGKGANLDAISKQLINLSKATGLELNDTAEGYYETLSNQLGNASQSMFVFENATKLAVATNSSLEDSINLISSSLTGYQLGAEQAAIVSGQLFEAINIGRFRAKDLADILGTVGPVASEMGVSLEESLASIANMTLQGTRATKAVTQLRAVLTQMLKPTEALKEVMESEWGVSNAQQAIIKFGGMNNVLFELDRISKGASNEMAEFFTNVRALSGAFGETQNIEKTKLAIEKINVAGADLIDWSSQLVLDQPAKQAQIAFNALKVEVTELGARLLPLGTIGAQGLTYLAQSADGVAAALIAIPLLSIGVNLKLVTTYFNSAATSAKLFRTSLLGIGAAAAFMLGWEIGQWLVNADKRLKDFVNTNLEGGQKIADAIKHANTVMTTVREEAFKKDLQISIQYFSELQKQYNTQLQTAKEVGAVSTELAKKQIGSIVDLQEALVNKLSQVEGAAQKQILDSEKNSLNIRRKINQQMFDWSIEQVDGLSKSYARSNRAQELVQAGLAQLSQRGLTVKQLEDAKELITLGSQQATQASQEASTIQDARQQRVALYRTRQQELSAQNALLQAEQRGIELSKEQINQAKIEQAEQSKRLQLILKYYNTIQKGVSQFDTQTGKQKSERQQLLDVDAGKKAFQELRKLFDSPENQKLLNISERFGLEDLGRKLISEAKTLPTLQVQLETNYNEQVKKLQAISEQLPVELKTNLKIAGFEFEEGTSPADISQFITNQMQEIQQQAPELKNITDRMIEAQQAISVGGGITLPISTIDIKAQVPELANLLAKYNELAQQKGAIEQLTFKPGSTDIQTLRQYRAALAEFIEETRKVRNVGDSWEQLEMREFLTQDIDLGSLKQLVLIYQSLETVFKELETADPTGNRFQELQNNANRYKALIQSISSEAQGQKLIDLTQFAQARATVETMKPTALLNSLNAANTVVQTMANTIKNMQPGVQGYSKGGLVKYFAAGGFASKGTDTIPAMLSPGEFVMNARSTKKFYSQLVAMNAGLQPIYRETGGSVTNNIGDINVTLTGGSNTKQSAREIATALRREMRRNTVSLK